LAGSVPGVEPTASDLWAIGRDCTVKPPPLSKINHFTPVTATHRRPSPDGRFIATFRVRKPGSPDDAFAGRVVDLVLFDTSSQIESCSGTATRAPRGSTPTC
jgi:hypothetical protein